MEPLPDAGGSIGSCNLGSEERRCIVRRQLTYSGVTLSRASESGECRTKDWSRGELDGFEGRLPRYVTGNVREKRSYFRSRCETSQQGREGSVYRSIHWSADSMAGAITQMGSCEATGRRCYRATDGKFKAMSEVGAP